MRAYEILREANDNIKLDEILFASSIADSSNIIRLLMPENSTKLGVVDHHTVYKLDAADCTIYYLYNETNSEPIAYLITEKFTDNGYHPFRQMEKLKDITGAAAALLQFLQHKNIRLVIRSNEPLTFQGITWISNMIKNPRGLNIHDGDGHPINLRNLWNEWSKSHEDYKYKGNISIYVESTQQNSEPSYCFEDQSAHQGLLKNPLRFIGDVELY